MNDSVIEPTVIRVKQISKSGGRCTVAVGARTPPRRLVVGCLAGTRTVKKVTGNGVCYGRYSGWRSSGWNKAVRAAI